MAKDLFFEAIDLVKNLLGESSRYDPFSLCTQLGISVITDKLLKKEGYLICSDGLKLIFVSANIRNRHRQEFVIAHEIGHFLVHQNQMYCCSNVSLSCNARVNTSYQEKEANSFATEILAPSNSFLPMLPNRSLSFSDISSIAKFFNISMSHAAIKCIQNSNTENEILLCYDGDQLKWFVAKSTEKYWNKIPERCPIDLNSPVVPSYVKGVWDDLYDGSVRQEVFHPYKNRSLVLLSGNIIDENW